MCASQALGDEGRFETLLQRRQSRIKGRIIAAVFDDMAGMGRCGAVTAKGARDIGQREARDCMGEIDGHLPGKSNRRLPPRAGAQLIDGHAKGGSRQRNGDQGAIARGD